MSRHCGSAAHTMQQKRKRKKEKEKKKKKEKKKERKKERKKDDLQFFFNPDREK